jgi:hypothetical protein
MSPAQPSKKEQRPRSRRQQRGQQRKRQPRFPLLAKIREPPVAPISVKIRQLPGSARAINRGILRSQPRRPRGALRTHAHDEDCRWERRAVGDADEPQLCDVREIAVVGVAVPACVFGWTAGDHDCKFLAPVGLERLLVQRPAFSVCCLTCQGEGSSGRVGGVQVGGAVFVGVCGVCELENDCPELEWKLQETAVFLTMSPFGKACNAGGSHIRAWTDGVGVDRP